MEETLKQRKKSVLKIVRKMFKGLRRDENKRIFHIRKILRVCVGRSSEATEKIVFDNSMNEAERFTIRLKTATAVRFWI